MLRSGNRVEVGALDTRLWRGSFNGRESTLQQLAPQVGKLKSGMARVLVRHYSQPGDTVLDPFCGSGVIPLECALLGRRGWANDLSPYAYAVTRGKLKAPTNERVVLDRATLVLEVVERDAPNVDLKAVPAWVRRFYHPQTLREVLVAL